MLRTVCLNWSNILGIQSAVRFVAGIKWNGRTQNQYRSVNKNTILRQSVVGGKRRHELPFVLIYRVSDRCPTKRQPLGYGIRKKRAQRAAHPTCSISRHFSCWCSYLWLQLVQRNILESGERLASNSKTTDKKFSCFGLILMGIRRRKNKSDTPELPQAGFVMKLTYGNQARSSSQYDV